MRDIALDLRPVGAIENILVEKIVAVLWRKRRLEGAEQDAISSVQMQAIKDEELKNALALDAKTLPDWMLEKEVIEEFVSISIKALPNWMLDENNAPNETDGMEAVRICDEWAKFTEQYIEPETEQQTRRDFSAHWACLKVQMKVDNYRKSVLGYLEEFYAAENFYHGFLKFMSEQQGKYYWIAYWHRSRDKMAAAFRAIRVKRMLGEWDLDRSHRYHTMIDNQWFKLLREFREIRSWRLSNLEMANAVDEHAAGPG